MVNRWIALDGVENIRDLGGLKNKRGETLATGQFYRGATFHHITKSGIKEAKGIGITTLVDLRSTLEVKKRPNNLMSEAGFTIINIPMLDRMQSNISEDFTGFPNSMMGLYHDLLSQYVKEFALVLKTLANTAGGTVFHCAVGKDRTGLVALFLLSIAGMDKFLISKDYAMSKPLVGQGPKDFPDLPAFIFQSEPQWMDETMAWIKKQYGSPVNYLLEAGVAEEDLDKIRNKFNVSLNLEG